MGVNRSFGGVITGVLLVALGCVPGQRSTGSSCTTTNDCPGAHACVQTVCISLGAVSDGDAATQGETNTGNESADSKVTNDTAPNCDTTSITVTYSGSLGTVSKATPLYVFLMNSPDPKESAIVASQIVESNGVSVTFTIAAGTYYVGALFDRAGNGPGPGDPVGMVYGGPQPKAFSPPICASLNFNDAQLFEPGGDSQREFQLFVGLNRRISDDGTFDEISLHTDIHFPVGDVLAIAISGPGIADYTYPMDQCRPRDDDGVQLTECGYSKTLVATPQVGDEYTFTYTRKDNSVEQVKHSLQRVILDPITITAPAPQPFTPSMLGVELAVTWTMPPQVQVAENLNLMGFVCPTGSVTCTIVQGTITSSTAGKLTLPGISGAERVMINVSFHDGDVSSGCNIEYRKTN